MPAHVSQPLAIIVGANIAARRQAKGWTQAEMAAKCGMGGDSLSRIEHGFVAPRFNRLEKIAKLLECSAAELFMTNDREGVPDTPLSRDSEIVFLAERIASLMRQRGG